MILANEAVAELLGSRRREALYRVHDPPEAQSIARLLAVLADLGVPTPAAPDRSLTPAQAAALAAEISERVWTTCAALVAARPPSRRSSCSR